MNLHKSSKVQSLLICIRRIKMNRAREGLQNNQPLGQSHFDLSGRYTITLSLGLNESDTSYTSLFILGVHLIRIILTGSSSPSITAVPNVSDRTSKLPLRNFNHPRSRIPFIPSPNMVLIYPGFTVGTMLRMKCSKSSLSLFHVIRETPAMDDHEIHDFLFIASLRLIRCRSNCWLLSYANQLNSLS